jgi:hypothetical protein
MTARPEAAPVKTPRRFFRITLRALPGGAPAEVRLRRALKALLRAFRFRAERVEDLGDGEPRGPPPAAAEADPVGAARIFLAADSKRKKTMDQTKKALETPPWVEEHFGFIVRTGFRRTDESTGRTVELLLCPGKHGNTPDQSYALFAELEGGSVDCNLCSEHHPVIDFADAVARGFIVASFTGMDYSEAINATAHDMAEAIRDAARPKRGVSRAKAVAR